VTGRCKSCDHDTQVHFPNGSGCGYVIAMPGHGDPACPCTLDAFKRPTCRGHEGATGIDCGLDAGHQQDHEGQHTPGSGERDVLGYPLFVRWPYTPWDIEHGIAPHTEGVNS
jgi:hypothetical protein